MNAFIAGLVASLVLAVVAGVVLSEVQQPAYRAFASSETRVGNPGHNLVGANWSGLAHP
ncbi:MAG: hypothetical protein ACREFO_15950 [Acetobacteraceae bacterium]